MLIQYEYNAYFYKHSKPIPYSTGLVLIADHLALRNDVFEV